MLRFDSSNKQPPRNYLARPEQLRLLTMITALALVGLLAWQVRSDRSRAVLAQLFGGAPAVVQANVNAADVAPAPASLDAARQWLNAAQIDSIRDNAVFRDAETDAWFAILGQLKSHAGPLSGVAAPPITYAQLTEQPQAYRGRAVRVVGTIQRVEPQTPAENELGIDRLNRVIFRPAGDEVWPIAVYTLEPPKGVAVNEPVSRAATAVGVFFKNLSYQSQAGAGTMPVVLAQSVEVEPVVAPPPPAPIENNDLLTVAAIAAAVAIVVVIFIARRN